MFSCLNHPNRHSRVTLLTDILALGPSFPCQSFGNWRLSVLRPVRLHTAFPPDSSWTRAQVEILGDMQRFRDQGWAMVQVADALRAGLAVASIETNRQLSMGAPATFEAAAGNMLPPTAAPSVFPTAKPFRWTQRLNRLRCAQAVTSRSRASGACGRSTSLGSTASSRPSATRASISQRRCPPPLSTQGPSWGYLKSQFSRDLVDFWR